MFRSILIVQHFGSHWQRHRRMYTRYSSLVSWKIQFDWNLKQFLLVWLYCSALHGTTLTADSGGVCTVWIESTVTSTLPLLVSANTVDAIAVVWIESTGTFILPLYVMAWHREDNMGKQCEIAKRCPQYISSVVEVSSCSIQKTV